MIEGNFKDVSLPGLLQFLGAEVSKNYRVRVSSSGQAGEIYVCRGFVVAAGFGLLEGEDAVCEFLCWRDGSFFVETLTPQVEVKKNLKRAIQPGNAFIENSLFLAQNNVGLNTVIVASKSFGSVEWQESLRQQPLEREDFVVLGWVGEGRTMKQALREFGFDIAQATGILCRLIKSDSIQILRPGSPDAQGDAAAQEDPVVQRFVSTGGQNEAAANVAQAAARAYAQEATAAVAQDAFISTSFKPGSAPMQDQKEQKQGNPLFNPIKKIGIDLAQVRASMEARLRSRGSARRTGDHPVTEAGAQSATSSSSGNFPVSPANYPNSAAGTGSGNQGANFNNSAAGISANYSGTGGSFGPTTSGTNLAPTPVGPGHGAPFFSSPQVVPAGQPAEQQAAPQRVSNKPQTTPPVRAAELIKQQQQQQQQTVLSPEEEPEPLDTGSAADQLFASGWQDSSTSVDLDDLAPSMVQEQESEQDNAVDTSELDAVPDPSRQRPPQSKTKSGLAALLAEANQAVKGNAAPEVVVPLAPGAGNTPKGRSAQPVVAPTSPTSPVAPLQAAPPAAKASDAGSAIPRSRTEALPMVTIDIDRLLHATFTPTQFGKLALTNPALDQHRRQTLLDVEAGKSLGTVIAEETRPAAAILSSFRYCLDRGYIDSSDSVVPLTADLLLGRMEIDQYLLQRRRLTGDQLRDLVEIARNEAVKLAQVLVRCGYLTSGDLETLEREQKRFAFK